MEPDQDTRPGASYLGEGRCRFRVWAPARGLVEVHLLDGTDRWLVMDRDPSGVHHVEARDVQPGTPYRYRLDGSVERPDPASRDQRDGVHGPSRVPGAGAGTWTDADWRGIPREAHVFYEVHVGAFTPEGTFDAIVPHLDHLVDLGVTALELMPVATFPGRRNWGYDGVYLYAVHDAYGGAPGLRRLVDACHRRGLAVVLDVVYNHLGPEGNYLAEYGPYFTDRYRTPWGAAVNFDGPGSDGVRRFFLHHALECLRDHHVDALRLDAVHGILDFSAQPFLRELSDAVRREEGRLGRRLHLFPESDLNDARVVQPAARGGLALDAQWSDDFHHAVHALLTGERTGYYEDFGTVEQLARAFAEGWVFQGGYSPHRQRRHGNSSREVEASRLIVFAQNHDQVGNRAQGERLTTLVPPDAARVAAALVLLSPFLPLLFMGEEYGETAPFLYFVSHGDPDLQEAVRRGRREEFRAFAGQAEVPDPADEATFLRSRLRHELAAQPEHRARRAYYRELLRLRREVPALASTSKDGLWATAFEAQRALAVRRPSPAGDALAVFALGEATTVRFAAPPGRWRRRLDSQEERWGGPGSGSPGDVVSDGTLEVPLAARTAALFVHEGQGA